MKSNEPIAGGGLFTFLRLLSGQRTEPDLGSDSAVCAEARAIAAGMPEHVSPDMRRLMARAARQHMRQVRKAEKKR